MSKKNVGFFKRYREMFKRFERKLDFDYKTVVLTGHAGRINYRNMKSFDRKPVLSDSIRIYTVSEDLSFSFAYYDLDEKETCVVSCHINNKKYTKVFLVKEFSSKLEEVINTLPETLEKLDTDEYISLWGLKVGKKDFDTYKLEFFNIYKKDLEKYQPLITVSHDLFEKHKVAECKVADNRLDIEKEYYESFEKVKTLGKKIEENLTNFYAELRTELNRSAC